MSIQDIQRIEIGAGPVVKFRRMPHGHGLPLPAYATPGASGLDLCAAIHDPIEWRHKQPIAIPTGFQIEIARGYEGQVRGRSGLALRHGITITHGVGTIDNDFRGEIIVMLACHAIDGPALVIERGMRIAQMIIAPVSRARIIEVDELGDSARGARGFGSTGI